MFLPPSPVIASQGGCLEYIALGFIFSLMVSTVVDLGVQLWGSGVGILGPLPRGSAAGSVCYLSISGCLLAATDPRTLQVLSSFVFFSAVMGSGACMATSGRPSP